MPDAVVAILLAAGGGCIAHLFLDAYRTGSRRRAQLQGIELRADTTRRDEYSSALRAKGGRSW
jgi:hypothetical protein